MAELYKRIEGLCKENDISITQMCKNCGASRGSLSDLANNRIQSLSANTLQKIASYFNVSTDYLTGKSKYKNIKEVKEYNWGLINDPYFEPPFDFASLLSPLRKEQGISLSEFGNVIGATEEQMNEIENGLLPINFDQAEKLCNYLGTNVSQVFFDNDMYNDDVPEEYHNNIREWEKNKERADIEAIQETNTTRIEITNPNIKMIARAGKKMTPEQAENLRKYAQYMFPEAFEDD